MCYNCFRLMIVVNASRKSTSRLYCYHIGQTGVGDLSTCSSTATEAGPCVWLLQNSTLSTGKAQEPLTTVMNQAQQERGSKERGPASQPTSQHSWLRKLASVHTGGKGNPCQSMRGPEMKTREPVCWVLGKRRQVWSQPCVVRELCRPLYSVFE